MRFEEMVVNMRIIQNLVQRNWEILSGDPEPLSFYQCVYLVELEKGKSLRPTELAERMGCDLRAAHEFTDRLIVRGLINKKKLINRNVLLSLSGKGRDVVAKFRGAMESMEATCLGDLPLAEIEIAHKVISQLLERSR